MNPEEYSIEAGPMGPIGESQSLILRVNRNCPWNQCLFCPVYKDSRFSTRSLDEIKHDVDAIQRICDLLEKTSWEIGLQGRIKREVIHEAVALHPEIYGTRTSDLTGGYRSALYSLHNVANWLLHGGRRVFLQDANALAMKPGLLAQALQYLKQCFPCVETVTCYARSKTCSRRPLQELKGLGEAGLSWCFVGIESGHQGVLNEMRKGVTAAEHVDGGRKLMEAGIHMAAFIMPGLAGSDKDKTQGHIADTLRVLNDIQPTEIRVRSLAVIEGSPLHDRWKSGVFKAPTEDQMIEELRRLIEGLAFDCTFETLQMTNALFAMKAPFSQTKEIMLQAIHWYQELPSLEKAQFLFKRYVEEGYLEMVKGWGRYDKPLHHLIHKARNSIEEGLEDALEMTDEAVFAIKSKGIP